VLRDHGVNLRVDDDGDHKWHVASISVQ
jgi:hypothetical protein